MQWAVEKLIIVSGPSGAGKTTICKHLLAVFGNILVLSVSETTRQPRASETYGRDYVYVSESEFQERIGRFHYLEWVYHHGYYYGTPREPLLKAIADGRVPLLDIEIRGKEEVARFFPQHVSIFIAPVQMEQLEARLRQRASDTPEDIVRRLHRANTEMKAQSTFHHVLVNDRLDDTLTKVVSIVEEYLEPIS